MLSFSTAILLVAAFLLLNLVVGLMSRKPITFREYAVADKRFSTVQLLATILASDLGSADFICSVQVCHHYSMPIIITFFSIGISFWLISLVWVRMVPFMHHLSIAETIGSVYGKYPRIVIALLCIFRSIVTVAVEIKAVSSVISICISSTDPTSITILTSLVLIVYATFGGIGSITNTDILQFITSTVIIFFIAKLMFIKTGKSLLEIVSFAQEQGKFKDTDLVYIKRSLWNCVVFPLCFSLVPDPMAIQRVYMCSSPIQVKKVFLYSSFFYLVIIFFMSLIGLFVVCAADRTLSVTEVWNYIIASVPPFFGTSVAICTLAMAMSTADSSLHFCSVLVAHDLMESIRGVKPISNMLQIWIARLALLVSGLLSMMIAIWCNDLWIDGKDLIAYFQGFYMGVVCCPFVLAVFGFRGTARTALIGMVIAILVTLTYKKWYPLAKSYTCIASLLANGLGMMVAHYLLPQPSGTGWVGLNAQQKRLQQFARVFKRYRNRVDLE